jgi:curved DNA-binding protein CbpA
MSGDGPITLPPEELEADPEERVREWAETIDRIDYLTLLGLSSLIEPTDDEVRDAWRAFALSFHPDRHRDSEDDVRLAATRVFQRGAEAYRVLQDPVLRKRYLRLLAEGHLRMPQDEVAQSRRGTDRLQDIVRSAGARPFAVRADELIAKGDLKQARLQLQLAVMREPSNAHLEERLRELEELLAKPRRP